jgi:hypothetical protein
MKIKGCLPEKTDELVTFCIFSINKIDACSMAAYHRALLNFTKVYGSGHSAAW